MSELLDNKYFPIKTLGEGGFGIVFLAREQHSDNLVAIKQLKNEDKAQQDTLIKELQIVSRFNHPHIVAYKHTFVQNALLYIVMEYCSIGCLRRIMLTPRTTSTFIWKWMSILTNTLQFVHEKGIIHHDIKPDNILFTEDRTLKIADFGVANTSNGTIAYMSPESFEGLDSSISDARVDVYALGVTLLEVLTGKNPFMGKMPFEIEHIHNQKDFGINGLPSWQQEVILKAIAKEPELRFQSMRDFNEAIAAKSVPIVLDKEIIKAGDIAHRADSLIKLKKWQKALSLLEYAERELKPSVSVLRSLGTYHILQNNIDRAKLYFEKALKWNPRLNVQKELGWINVEQRNFPTAISLLSDYLHRNQTDYEAYNLLIQCFYETNRYEYAIDLARTLMETTENNQCFVNNYYVCSVMKNLGQTVFPDTVLRADKSENPFLDYNYSVILESRPTHGFQTHPTLKSKLLFMDYRFNNFSPSSLYCLNSSDDIFVNGVTKKSIIIFGRSDYDCNDIRVPGGTSISRRHCLITNYKDDIWLHDLESSGTYLNNIRIRAKTSLIGQNKLRIGSKEYILTNDKSKLL